MKNMTGDIKSGFWTNPLGIIRAAFIRIRDRIGLLNPGQKRVLFGLVFFLFVNAVILVSSIIVFFMLIGKL